jgi:hypothetical protein
MGHNLARALDAAEAKHLGKVADGINGALDADL